MLRVQDDQQGEVPPGRRKAQAAIVWTYFAIIAANYAYAALLWIRFEGAVFPASVASQFRLGLWILTGSGMVASYVLAQRAGVLRPSPSSKPGWWTKFERGLLLATTLNVALHALYWNVFSFVVDLEGTSEAMRAIPWLGSALRWAEQVNLPLLAFYLAIKIPVLAGGLAGSFNRLYVGRWRVHESVVGLALILLGSLVVLFAIDVYDRGVGLFFVVGGAFFMGRDYEDVRRFKFLNRVSAPEAASEKVGGAGGEGEGN
ncbi:MAG: hypothetical protein Kow0069_28390 [Promethearchaeota archaeon]